MRYNYSRFMPKKVHHISLRDPELRARIDAFIAERGNLITLSRFVRAAVEEKLERMERGREDRQSSAPFGTKRARPEN